MRKPPSSVFRALLWLLVLLAGCTDAYLPEVISSPQSLLVVDGFLNSQGVTSIRLSHTFAVASKAQPAAETRATLAIEEENGTRFSLPEGSVKGTYASEPLRLDPTKKYRLHIRTLAGPEYASDFVPVKTTPPIDEVSWRLETAGLTIYVSSHDETNSTHYYRWGYLETWEINPPYAPTVEYVNHEMREIVKPFPTICWGNAPSPTVNIDKTTALTKDVITEYPLLQLPRTSERLNSRYSILVQQHALTKEEYAYWELLKKNTQSIGGLFDPQPVQLTGNVHNLTHPDEPALGYVGAHSLSEKRIFINRSELPAGTVVPTGYESCMPPDTVFFTTRPHTETLDAYFYGLPFLPINPLINGGLIGYTAKSRECIDCRFRGTSVKPSFW